MFSGAGTNHPEVRHRPVWTRSIRSNALDHRADENVPVQWIPRVDDRSLGQGNPGRSAEEILLARFPSYRWLAMLGRSWLSAIIRQTGITPDLEESRRHAHRHRLHPPRRAGPGRRLSQPAAEPSHTTNRRRRRVRAVHRAEPLWFEGPRLPRRQYRRRPRRRRSKPRRPRACGFEQCPPRLRWRTRSLRRAPYPQP